MSGNITEEGIGLDMEWMKRVGLGGMQNFDAALNTAQGGEKAPGLHDPRVEGGVSLRDQEGRFSRP